MNKLNIKYVTYIMHCEFLLEEEYFRENERKKFISRLYVEAQIYIQ